MRNFEKPLSKDSHSLEEVKSMLNVSLFPKLTPDMDLLISDFVGNPFSYRQVSKQWNKYFFKPERFECPDYKSAPQIQIYKDDDFNKEEKIHIETKILILSDGSILRVLSTGTTGIITLFNSDRKKVFEEECSIYAKFCVGLLQISPSKILIVPPYGIDFLVLDVTQKKL